MAKCSHCRQRKSKRVCPALRAELCPLCCGRLREREVGCPPDCPHLEGRQGAADGGETGSVEEAGGPEILSDERMAWLALHAGAPLAEIGRVQAAFGDADAVRALEYAREKLAQGGGRLILPGLDRRPRDAAGEAVLQALDACRYERSVIITGGTEGYRTEDKIRVLDRLLISARSAARKRAGGRLYLDQLIAQYARMRRNG